MTVEPLASVVIPNWNGAHLLHPCLDSLRTQTYPSLEVILADGASSDGSLDLVRREYPHVRVVRLTHNQGFAGNVNAGLRAARGDVLLLLNNDAIADPNWVQACVAALEAYPDAGSIAGKQLFHQDGRTINAAGDLLRRNGQPVQRGSGALDGPEWNAPAPVFGASGNGSAFRRALLADVGLFDETFFAYLEDLDLAFRAQLRGWSCVYAPDARVLHLGSATGGGPLASYYNGRNLVRLLARNVPTGLLPALLPGMLRYQAQRARDAAHAWRGAAARATLRGQVAGILGLPRHLADRRPIQRRRRVSDAAIYHLLAE